MIKSAKEMYRGIGFGKIERRQMSTLILYGSFALISPDYNSGSKV